MDNTNITKNYLKFNFFPKILISFKKLKIFSGEISWNNMCSDLAVKWLSLIAIKSKQVSKICSMVECLSHPMHTGGSSPCNKKEWVIKEWPVCNWAITVSSFLFVRGQTKHSFNTGNILYNLFSRNSSHSDCHNSNMCLFVRDFRSENGMNSTETTPSRASLAAESATEFLLMPIWLGTQMKTISLPSLVISGYNSEIDFNILYQYKFMYVCEWSVFWVDWRQTRYKARWSLVSLFLSSLCQNVVLIDTSEHEHSWYKNPWWRNIVVTICRWYNFFLDGKKESFCSCVHTLQRFASMSGLTINIYKTVAVWIGSQRNLQVKFICQNIRS